MEETIVFTEVPYLQEILNFLPIDPVDEEDTISYIKNITNLVMVNYQYGQYQFAYFGVHLLFMTYIYCTAWKVSQIEPARYNDAIVFARAYSGRENELKIEEVESVFSYSLIPEKDIAKLFKIIGLDTSQIDKIGKLISKRNDMAHATGKFEILTEESFDIKVKNVLILMRAINKCMDKQIRKWYMQVLLRFCVGEYIDYEDPKDIIEEQMIQTFKLSLNELLICNEMSVSPLITEHRDYQDKLKKFKKELALYCEERGGI